MNKKCHNNPKIYERRQNVSENYRGICILNTRYKFSKILNVMVQRYSEQFMKEALNGFPKVRSGTDPTFFLELLFEKRRQCYLETQFL
jgi:hypothetical protein